MPGCGGRWRWLPLPMDIPAQIPWWELLFLISMGVWWVKGFMRGPVNLTLRWAPWLKRVIGPEAEPLSSPLNPAVTTGALPPVPMLF